MATPTTPIATEKRPCAKCKTAGGVAMCDGCQRSFCMPHFVAHRQELSLEMDNVGQNYDLLRRDIYETNKDHPLLVRIDTWEQSSINKIKKAAETARAELQKLLGESKNRLELSVTQITEEIRTSRNSDDFTENEFRRWTEQLNELRQSFESPSNVTIENEDEDETVINLINISDQSQLKTSALVPAVGNHFRSAEKPNIFFDEKFDQKTNAVISDNYLIATCQPKYHSSGAIVYGVNTYSSGTHDISFRIEKKGLSRLFFGIYSSIKNRVDTVSGCENSVYGWWDVDSGVLNGTRLDSGNEHIISTGDKIVLTLDCDQQHIQLYHIRENREVQLAVDINKCPFPWKIVVKLTSNGDCIRLL